ncbi:MAG: universal stress protein [Desulfobacca sp.]|uniref:universal stress protein n=1 Tax=Desulfobacca sp. TaxID=2067990 RepID=UPI00404A31B1
MQARHPLTRILLPFDGSPSARLAVQYAAALVQGSGGVVEQLTLTYVTGGSYLARHLQNVDFRAVRLEQTAAWQRLKEQWLEREVRPLLAAGQEILTTAGVQVPIDLQVGEGRIGEQLLSMARQGDYTAIILGRRGLSPIKEFLLGSVTEYILTHAQGITVFVVGQGEGAPAASPLFPLLLPVDGSETSLAALRQAIHLVRSWQAGPPRLELLHVVDLALLGQTLTSEAQLLVAEGHRALGAARAVLAEAGLQDGIEEKLVSGNPPQVIAQEARQLQCPLVLMGSVGHSVLGRLILGSVTQSVLHLTQQATIAVVYPTMAESS